MFETIYYKKPDGDKLFKYLSDNLKGCELAGYTRMAAFYEDGVFKGCAALKYTQTYCSLDFYAPRASFTRKAIKDFFNIIFSLVPICLCVIKNNNAHSVYAAARFGFKPVKVMRTETLFRLTKTDFERGFLCKTK